MTSSTTHRPGFRHEAFFYADADDFLAGTVPFIRSGLEAEEAILVAMPRPRLDLLGDALSGDGERVQFADMEELGRNPARIIPAWRDFLDEHMLDGRGMRGIGEPIWSGRSVPEIDECQRHEHLLNVAFAGASAFSLMCPYDTARLDDRVLEDAEHSHPLLCRDDRVSKSGSYDSPPPSPFDGVLNPPPAEAAATSFTMQRLSDVRYFAAERAQAIGLKFSRIDDFVLAANELATNSLQHGRGKATMRIWREGDAIACEVDDDGRIDRPLAGRQRPRPDQARGRGLWLVNQLCDLVQIRSGDDGSMVRLQMDLRVGSGS